MSIRALVADFLGEDPYAERTERLSIREAFRACERGQVMAARHRGADVALFVLEDGRAFVTPDACPHDGGYLSDGFVEGGRLVCARHGWEFDACSGACATRDAVIPTRLVGRKR